MSKHLSHHWHHLHQFDSGNPEGERRTTLVVGVTAAMMVVEILAGWLTGSMALLADGWHMATHAFALGITLLAYQLSRRWALNPQFSFGSWKIEIIGSFASAIVLLMIAGWMLVESGLRLFSPLSIQFGEAVAVAVIGLVVNLVCALLLHQTDHSHHHGHDHAHGPHHSDDRRDHAKHDHVDEKHHHAEHAHEDLNLKSAYIHVVTDAATSVLAILALLGAQYTGLNALDPIMGLVGALLVGSWSIGLIKQSGAILMDKQAPQRLLNKIRLHIEQDGDAELVDLHVWQVGKNVYSCILVIVADEPKSANDYRKALSEFTELAHITVEVNRCPGQACQALQP
jgi:cation diffusion facilitator family transporter